MQFRRDALAGVDQWDAFALSGPAAYSIALVSFTPDGEALAIDARPEPEGAALELPLSIRATAPADTPPVTLTLDWTGLDELPHDMDLALIDSEARTEVNLREIGSYTFTTGVSTVADGAPPPAPLRINQGDSPVRFTLRMTPANTVANERGTEPFHLVLDAPYPNPFRDILTLGYAVPDAGTIRLAVYDVLGREVARLFDGAQVAGHHTAAFDARGLAGGLYLIRLEGGSGLEHAVRTTRVMHVE